MGNEQGYQGADYGGIRKTHEGEGAPYVAPKEPWKWDQKKKKKKMHEWSPNDVKDYMASLTYTETTRNVMENNITGKDLLLSRSPQQLADKLHIPVEKAEGIYEMLQLQKQKQLHGAKKKSKQDINLNFIGSRSWKKRAIIYWTPYNVKSWFVTTFGGKVDGLIKKKILDAIDHYVLNGEKITNIEDAKTLAALFKIDERIAAMIHKALEEQMESEGNDDEKEDVLGPKEYRFRKLAWTKYKFIKLSKKPDCIMGYADKDGIDRAEMKCGHAIAADTMFHFIKSIIEKNKNAVFIMCPVPDCDTEWDWNTCLRIADMNDHEITKYNLIRANRKPDTIILQKTCPYCGELTKKLQEMKNYRVKCDQCKKGDWCFGCEQPWKSSGRILCGNSNCKLVSGINDILQNCPMQDVSYLSCKIPKYRACPTCLAPIEHLPGCKHMDCKAKNCGTQFCFICLAVYDANNGGWPKACNEGSDKEITGKTSYSFQCKFAPRQYFV
eukprot:300647_1